MRDVLVKDVGEVFAVDNKTDKIYYLGVTDTSNINQSLDQTPITGGIGNKRVATLSSDKAIAIEVTTTLHSSDVYEMQSGSLFESGAITVLKQETVMAVDNESSIELPITGTPVDDNVTVIDKFGKEVVSTNSIGKVTITEGIKGEVYTVIYHVAEATANILDLNAEKMPSTYDLQVHTIGFDPKLEEVVVDIFWVFPQARPDGNMSAAYSKGENQSDSITFNAETPIGTGSLGKYVEIERAEG